MLVATACISRIGTVRRRASFSSAPRRDSTIILIPMNRSSPSAIYGTKRWITPNQLTSAVTSTQPIIGIKNWKKL